MFFAVLLIASSLVYSDLRRTEAAAPVFLAFDGKNAKGESVDGSAELIDQDTGEVLGQGKNKNTIPAPVAGKKVKMKFIPDSNTVSSLEFDDIEVAEAPAESGNGKSKGKGQVDSTPEGQQFEIRFDEPPTPSGFDNIIAIGDVAGFNFSKGRFKKVAQGKDLFKCTQWDYEGQACNGRWKKILKIKPGEEYIVEFMPGDPGYAEGSKKVNVLNKNSELLNYIESASANAAEPAKIDVVIALEEPVPPASPEVTAVPTIESITVTAIDETVDTNDLIIEATNDNIAEEAIIVDTTNVLAETVVIEQTATSDILLSCLNYDDASATCGRWKKERNLAQEENYIVSISSPGKSVFGQSRDGVIVLNENLEVLGSSNQIEETEGRSKIALQLTDLNPHKIVTYFDSSTLSSTGTTEVLVNTAPVLPEAVTTENGKVLTFDLSSSTALEADIEGTADGWDLFHCGDFDLETQSCRGKYKKFKDINQGEIYTFKIARPKNYENLLESKKKISVLNENEELLNYTETEAVEDGKAVVEIVPGEEGNPIRKIKVRNPNPSLGNDLKISPTVTANQSFLQGYAIDPTSTSAESMELELEAKGNTLYKCKEWDFAGNSCLGEWVKYKTLNPGEVYTVPIDNQDPGFMEVNESSPSGGSSPVVESAPAPSPEPTPAPEPEPDPVPQSSSQTESETAPTSSSTNTSVTTTTAPTSIRPSSGSGGGSSGGYIKTSSITSSQALAVSSTATTSPTVLTPNTNNQNFTVTVSSKIEFKNRLQAGAISNEVKELQKFLNNNGFILTKTGPGSPGKETNKFGPLTKRALAKFQETHAEEILKPLGLEKGTGILGPRTRNFINKLLK